MERISLPLEEFVGKLNEELANHPECLPGMRVIIQRPELKYSYEICDPTRDPTKPGSLQERMRAHRVFNPTATSIFDMRATTQYVPPTYLVYPQEATYV